MTLRLIVPGASGFIGRNLVLATPTDWEVVAVYHNSRDFPAWVKQKNLPQVTAAGCDLNDETAVHELARRVGTRFDACVFLSANGDPAYSVEHPLLDLQATVVTLLHFLSHFEIDRLIYFSSGAVYDGLIGPVSPLVTVSPRLPYAITHLACEHYAQAFTHWGRVGHYVNLRFFGAYGPFEPPRKLYTRLVRRFAFERVPHFTVRGDGRNHIDAMYVEDAIRGVLAVLENDRWNLTVDFCSGAPMTINELVEIAARTFGLSDLKIEHTGQVSEYINFSASKEAVAQQFHFRPQIPLEEGLQRFAEFMSRREEAPHG
ncbi:MAG: NAD(P)-dependent oxidoreductase [Deltaproteobacteria bacterium]|nr:NAD(P)-dependent oxidoreductase [Deltaproteobacteria bacterium]